MNTTIKPKACKCCKSLFTPARPLARACSPLCAMDLVRQANAKKAKLLESANRKDTRAKLEKLKPRAKWLAECQVIINKIVRLRDASLGCCSCDRPASWDGQWHASHLRSVGAASAIRFNLWNIAKSCSICNNYLSGNLQNYLPRARARLGDDKVDWLYSQNQLTSYSTEYLARLKHVMSRKLKRMERRNGR